MFISKKKFEEEMMKAAAKAREEEWQAAQRQKELTDVWRHIYDLEDAVRKLNGTDKLYPVEAQKGV